jgi:hypothetical protein
LSASPVHSGSLGRVQVIFSADFFIKSAASPSNTCAGGY